MKLRHFRLISAALVGTAVAWTAASRLHSYDVPAALTTACTLALFANVMAAISHVFEVVFSTTHRCRVPGCRFRVRLSDADAVESRR
ncbi:hypothetical protein SMD11_1576 [Streptomyces albireticuli]|uniref:Uncharacterized protein n=1 Tax=Streptomyces albireticuli TaxID=1940 RepID=A0A1Z2KYV1_9ACTN|nr:hypothetical protein [Streptomyces albireticuli]ARZ67237.1 hypothetical protein SMD11_1576 [Streptomyces albireticuli]